MSCEKKGFHMGPGFLMMSILLLYLVIPSLSIQAEIYQWQDKDGNLHFTDDPGNVPQYMRDRIKIVPMPSYRSNTEPQPTSQARGIEDVDSENVSNSKAEAREAFQEEVSRWQKKLEEDLASLEELSRSINLTHTSWKRNQLKSERVGLENQILEDKKMLEEVLPKKGLELDIERYW